MQDGENDNGSNSGSDEAIWFSFLCFTAALVGAFRYPSTGMYLVLILMAGWFAWTLWEMTASRDY